MAVASPAAVSESTPWSNAESSTPTTAPGSALSQIATSRSSTVSRGGTCSMRQVVEIGRIGQRRPVDLAVGRQREGVEQHEVPGDQVPGQPLREVLAHLADVDRFGLREVGGEVAVGRAAALAHPRDDDGLADARVAAQHGLDLPGSIR